MVEATTKLEEERTRSNEGKSPEKSKGSRCQKKS
jgi:hypothetical protein